MPRICILPLSPDSKDVISGQPAAIIIFNGMYFLNMYNKNVFNFQIIYNVEL